MRVLVADDASDIRALLNGTLARAGYEVVLAPDGPTAWAWLEAEEPPSLAILDWRMPGLDGIEICRRLRARGAEPYVYTILLGRDGDGAVVEALDAGADDFLRVPFETAELEARLRAGRRIAELHRELIAAREALRREARHDALTGALTRRALQALLEAEMSRCVRKDSHLAVIFTDLDHFKEVNDRHGHGAGDMVLREVAARMRSIVRSYDGIGRYGGEEFVIALPDCDTLAASFVAERIRQLISLEPVRYNGEQLRVTASCGVASTERIGRVSLEQLLATADAALYRAKREGRDRVVAADTAVELSKGAPAARGENVSF